MEATLDIGILEGKKGAYEVGRLLTPTTYLSNNGTQRPSPFLLARVRETKTDKGYVAKMLNPDLGVGERAEPGELLRNEISILRHLDSKGVVSVIDTDTSLPFCYFIMPQAWGSLRDVLSTYQFSASTGANIGTEIALYLRGIHHKGIIHRDIKPDNILVGVVDERLSLTIADFGISVPFGTCPLPASRQLLSASKSFGTPGYSAPEQLRGDAHDTSADVFGLGRIFYELFDEQATAQEPVLQGLIEDMRSIDAKSRPTLDEILKVLQPFL